MLAARKSDREHRLKAIYRLIAQITGKLEFVDTIHDIEDYRLRLFGGSEEEKRYVLAAKLCARGYRRKIFRLRCLKFCLLI